MRARVLFGLVLLALIMACSGPAYYAQAISGQWKLMHARQDVQALLNNPDTSPELARDLKTADRIMSFARDSLDLPGNGSYSSYVEIEGEALVWNVVATEEFSLDAKTWCFPVAGCVPYRGYFNQQKARKFAQGLDDKGMDVHISPAAAYSSLGWFDDPLLSTMFSGSDIRLAAYLFHELAHQRLYVKDDGQFNEAYASFVEETGVKAWLESNQRQAELNKWLKLQDVSTEFTTLIDQLRSRLTGLYAGDEPDVVKRRHKSDAFFSFTKSYQQMVTERWGGEPYYAAWFEEPLNNAKLALYTTYEGGHCAFQQLWLESGGQLAEFHRLAEKKSRLQKELRTEWLKQSC